MTTGLRRRKLGASRDCVAIVAYGSRGHNGLHAPRGLSMTSCASVGLTPMVEPSSHPEGLAIRALHQD
jgi:hypothetical protein